MEIVNEQMKEMLNSIALKLVILAGIIFICVAVIVVIIKLVPALKPLNNFLLGITSLLGIYIWLQIYFL